MTIHRRALVWVLAALVLRAAIPAGYMPASLDSGLLFKLCPSGVPAELIAAISGADHQHHTNSDTTHFDAERCPIGQLLTPAIAMDDAWQVDVIPALAVYTAAIVPALVSRTPTHYRSRGPPA